MVHATVVVVVVVVVVVDVEVVVEVVDVVADEVVVVEVVVVIGGSVAGAGSASNWAVADRVKAMFVPPKNGLSTGVRSWNRPVNVTVTRLPMLFGQPV